MSTMPGDLRGINPDAAVKPFTRAVAQELMSEGESLSTQRDTNATHAPDSLVTRTEYAP